MNAAEVLAALCDKANDVAVASRISEASTQFALLNRGQIVNDSGAVIATLCKKAASFNVPNTSLTTRFSRSSSGSQLEGTQALESDELTESTQDHRRNSLSDLSKASLTADFDALSVQATAGSCLQDSAGNLSVDSLVEAICSDAQLLETLKNAIKSEQTNRTNTKRSSELVTNFAAVLTTMNRGNQKTASSPNSNGIKIPEGITLPDEKGTSHRALKKSYLSGERNAGKPKASWASPNSARHSFSLDNSTTTKSADYAVDSLDAKLLAFGWKRALDESSGRHYYYTVDHSQVTWENPLVGE